MYSNQYFDDIWVKFWNTEFEKHVNLVQMIFEKNFENARFHRFIVPNLSKLGV